MILVIGGAYQGKTEFACEQFGLQPEDLLEGSVINQEELANCKAVNHLHEYVRRLLLDKQDAKQIVLDAINKNPDIVVLCNELGCGLVPIEAFDRNYRETVGRILCEIAKHSDVVYRVYCGIGEKIK